MLSEDYVRWAFSLFMPDENPSRETISAILQSCPTTITLRHYFLMKSQYFARHPEFVDAINAATHRQRSERQLQARNEFMILNDRMAELRLRMNQLAPQMLNALELLSVAKEVSSTLREVTRRQQQLEKELDQMRLEPRA